MRTITVKVPEEIAVQMEGEALRLKRDVAELAGERLSERYAVSTESPLPATLRADLKPVALLSLDTSWARPEEIADEDDTVLLTDIRGFLGRDEG